MFTRNFSALSYFAVFLIFFSGCTVPEPLEKKPENLLLSLRIRPTWFQYRKDRAYKSEENRIQGHPFYDFNPFINIKSLTLNFFTVTPEDSDVLFELDLSSGRRYRLHNFCPQVDIWGKYRSSITKPNFTTGIIPRTVNQLGRPQEIIVFGNKKILSDFPGLYAHRTRVVGALVIQECPFGNCQPVEWKSKMILVGVDPQDSTYDGVSNLEDLKRTADWNYVRAFLQNYKGHIKRYQKRFPFHRLVGEVSAANAMRIILKPNQNLSKDDRLRIASSCNKLYDFALKSLGPKSITEKYYKRFREFFNKYENEYKTCMNYVQYDSVNYNADNHWFFAYVEGFMQMHDLDYVYRCDANVWEKITDMPGNFKRREYLNKCSDQAIESAIQTAPFTLKKLGLNNIQTQKYVEYDSLKGGTHEKIYSFVRLDPNIIDCEVNTRKDEEFFPQDVSWKSRVVEESSQSIIR